MNDKLQMTSLYISRISSRFTEEAVRNIFGTFQIGLVIRVDFVELEPVNPNMCSAFVHLDWWSTPLCYEILAKIENEPFCLYIGPALTGLNEFWRLARNLKPIPQTRLNLSQVVADSVVCTAELKSQRAEIEAQRATIQALTEQVTALTAKLEKPSLSRHINTPELGLSLICPPNDYEKQTTPVDIKLLHTQWEN